MRSRLPLEVPGGIESAIVPQGVGTSIFAPWAASASVTGTRTSSRLPVRRKNGWGLVRIVTRMSPAGAPPSPGSPWPRTRMRLPSSMPAGILMVIVSRLPSARWTETAASPPLIGRGEGDGHFVLEIGAALRPALRAAAAATAAAAKLLEQVGKPAGPLPRRRRRRRTGR